MTAALLPTATAAQTWQALRTLARPRRALAAATFMVLLAGTAAGLAVPPILGWMVNLILDHSGPDSLTVPVLLLLAAAVGQALLTGLGGILVARLGETMLASLRERVVDRALGLPLERVEAAGSGDLVSRVSGDVAVIATAVRSALPALAGAGFTVGLTVVALAAWVPTLSIPTTSVRVELGALKSSTVWLTLAVAVIGFGGVFAVYTYISTTLTDVAGVSRSLVPVALMLFGVGMVVGNAIGGRVADRGVIPGVYASITSLAVLLALFVAAAHNPWTAFVMVFGLGVGCAAVGPALQVRLMDVAEDAQTLAASLHHAAFNLANAFGAWIGGVVIAAGFGYTAPAAVGVLLALAGVAVFAISVRRREKAAHSRRDWIRK